LLAETTVRFKNILNEQESRAAASKPRDAEAILFGLMFANQPNLTKPKRLCIANLY